VIRRARIVAVALGVAALGVGYVAGRRGRVEDVPVRGACRPPPGPEGLFEPLDASAPVWAPQGRWELPTVGSIFRNRLATADSPLEGVEAVLLSPRDEECIDECPLALHVIGAPKGTAALMRIVASLKPNLRSLVRAPGLDADEAVWIERGSSRLEAHRDPSRVDPRGGNPLRALFISMPRPDYGPRVYSVGLALGDLPDPHFDRASGDAGDREGWMLLVSRVVDGSGEGRPKVWGAVAFVHAAGRASWRSIPEGAKELGLVFGSLWGHFGALPREIRGVYLDPGGRVHHFGPDLVLRGGDDDEPLRTALSALLRRA
jgi:hypothetical protein